MLASCKGQCVLLKVMLTTIFIVLLQPEADAQTQ